MGSTMLRTSNTLGFLGAAALLISHAIGQDRLQRESVDLNAIHKIKTAELGLTGDKPKSQIADLAFYLTDQFGPRLTNSPQFRRSADWAVQHLRDWGISNVHLETWPTPARRPIPGWECAYFNVSMVDPTYQQLIGVPQTWSPATPGIVIAEAILAESPRTMEEFGSKRGKFTGKIILTGGPPYQLPLPETPLARRYTAEELTSLTTESIRVWNPFPPGPDPDDFDAVNMQKIEEFWAREKPLAVLLSGKGYDSTTVFQGGTLLAGNLVEGANPKPMAILAAEHYNRIARLLVRNVPVKVQLEIRTAVDDTLKNESFNVIGEIPGGAKKEEVVLVGAHLDSWAAATGATDNAIGCAVVMEAMRLLRDLKLPMDRTVRMALWGGEEQGRLGSRAYVKEHFADPADMRLKPEHEKLSAYFNLDGGSGRIRGIYLRHNEMVRPIFEGWFAALKDLTSGAVSMGDIDDEKPVFSDQMSFDAVGLPAFQFLQDPLDFETRTLHTNMDTFDRIQIADAEQMAVVVASFLYNAATRADQLPRKELPKPRSARP
jgi:carboxypeptidase Q